ncbi:ABC transporter [Enterobacter asburiae]|uniref:ABC transporter n=1 Tax=Enterobacter asburiae TaxID=61645 RepID=A0A376FIC9_ENTAS|nr:ABC transporter [Enterobacter asburiae]
MTQMISKTQAPVKRAGRIDPIAFFERFGVLIFMILLLIFFQSQNSNFFSERNIFNILTEVSIYGIMAVGMTFVILTAGDRPLRGLHSGGVRHDRGVRDQR